MNDQWVGTLKGDDNTDVWQCWRTGCLYFLGQPRKNYVGLNLVRLGGANPIEPFSSTAGEKEPLKKKKNVNKKSK